jgi:hypothetical protein
MHLTEMLSLSVRRGKYAAIRQRLTERFGAVVVLASVVTLL